jgi:SPP1 gp7 family putative phage head morphogenesis protein
LERCTAPLPIGWTSPRELARRLKKTFAVETSKAERLMRTELARVQIASQEQSLKANGFDKYEFIALGDACGTCKGLDGKTFTLKQLKISGNAPPMHPNCRCAIAPATNDPEYEAWLDGFSKHGLSFEEWKQRNSVAKPGENNIIKSRNISERRMANGLRTSPYHILSDEEIKSVKKAAKELNIPENILRFNQGNQTGFSDRKEIINIRGDILPDKSSNNLRDILSSKAVLAHEYYGHYKNHPSQFRVGD